MCYNNCNMNEAGLRLKIEVKEAWAKLENPNISLDEGIARLKAQCLKDTGRELELLEIDRINNKIKYKIWPQ